MKIYHTRPAPFNFLNGTGMRIVSDKRGKVRMGAMVGMKLKKVNNIARNSFSFSIVE